MRSGILGVTHVLMAEEIRGAPCMREQKAS